MGRDYRYPDVYDPSQGSSTRCTGACTLCDGCRACLDTCPCGALTDDGYDADRCHEYRNNPENQERASTHTVMKCMRCMTACDKKRIKERLKELQIPAQQNRKVGVVGTKC